MLFDKFLTCCFSSSGLAKSNGGLEISVDPEPCLFSNRSLYGFGWFFLLPYKSFVPPWSLYPPFYRDDKLLSISLISKGFSET